MSLHFAGFGESIDAAGNLVNIAALPDDVISTNDDDLQVPSLNQVLAIIAGVSLGGEGYARLEAPSLLRKSRQYISPVNGNNDGDVEPGSPPAVMDMRENPLRLRSTEDIQALVDSDTTSPAFQWLLMLFSDGSIVKPSGEMFTIRATAAVTLVAGQWTQGQMTFQDNLPAGKYAVVGLSAIAAGLVAARLVFRGGEGWRPGCLGRDSESDLEHPMFRYGGLGVWGEFSHNAEPGIEFLSISADTAEVVLLDLIQVRAEV